MRKSLLAGMAVCTAALAFAGSADALVKRPAHRHPARVAESRQIPAPEYGARGYPTQFRIPAHPLVWDCVHVMFPQCGRGYNNLNDGSFQ
jgi:hypothetical protein